ncbi:MAG: 3-dehydroquinate synthase [Verrucomicrobiota bacterium]|nr:3-dehydroquinate synthase [Verrucomicrobiota bacterium]
MIISDVCLDERSYKILIGKDIINMEDTCSELRHFSEGKNVFLVSDSNVAELYEKNVKKLLSKTGTANIKTEIFPPGEKSKNLSTIEGFYHSALKVGLDRASIVVALGGGVTGDMAGFLAATYMRGIDFIQIPTSLLAMVDSSVGGKVGVDLPEGKNLVGAFLQPKIVIIDTNFLLTLPSREIRCGLAEVIKYGVILDEDFFSYLESNVKALREMDLDVYESLIKKCCDLKAHIVCEDEKEHGVRSYLNYGHTFGHAIETLGGYEELNHGEAVSIGMMMAGELACLMGLFDRDLLKRQRSLLTQVGLPVTFKNTFSSDEIINIMQNDKKTQGGNLRLILPEGIGKVKIVKDADKSQIKKAIENAID